jgi:putative DNA-invertase from lambdoid prophage Rac
MCRVVSKNIWMPHPPVIAALYVRVSTDKQDYSLQLHDLHRYAQRMGWKTIEYAEKESSVKRRPVFERMLEDARLGKVGAILVWRIDRFARSMKDYVMVTLDLYQWKVRLISVTEKIDTSDENPFAEFQRGLLALLAQLERRIIVARVNAGIAEAKRQGKHCGRPKRVFRRDEAMRMRAEGRSIRQIAATLGVSAMTVQRAVAPAESSS